jgi:hypothetical protein
VVHIQNMLKDVGVRLASVMNVAEDLIVQKDDVETTKSITVN